MKLFRESSICEDYILRKLQEKGWIFSPADDIRLTKHAQEQDKGRPR